MNITESGMDVLIYHDMHLLKITNNALNCSHFNTHQLFTLKFLQVRVRVCQSHPPPPPSSSNSTILSAVISMFRMPYDIYTYLPCNYNKYEILALNENNKHILLEFEYA